MTDIDTDAIVARAQIVVTAGVAGLADGFNAQAAYLLAGKSVPDLLARLAEVEAALEEAQKKIERLKWAQIYLPSGRCRLCGGTEGNHGMSCKHYVGPLEHRWVHTRVNPTFGGIDYTCACGGWFRQGGMAGHGDGTSDSEPMCSNADLDWRGERPVAPEHSGD